MRVVIAHDFMETYGGAERVTQEMARAFPAAPIFTILARPTVVQRMGVVGRVHSLLPPRPSILRNYRLATPAFPALVDAARLPEADVLLTSSYAFALRFRTPNRAPQVCYCHSPLRFAWSMTDDYSARHSRGPVTAAAFAALARGMRRADRQAADRVDTFLTGSEYVASQIERFYDRAAKIARAPVDTDVFRPARPSEDGGYFLFCGRLIEPYKRTSMAIEAFRRLPGERLVIAGDGPARESLAAGAPPNVDFVGALDDLELVEAMQHCRAGIFPSRDDLGLIPLELMACGRPVIAFAGGGARHTVTPGVTGALFAEQTIDALVAAIRGFDPSAFDPAVLREEGERWSADRFRARLVRAAEAAAA